METIDKVVRQLGTADIDARLEELLIDGILYAYQEQVGARCPNGKCMRLWVVAATGPNLQATAAELRHCISVLQHVFVAHWFHSHSQI